MTDIAVPPITCVCITHDRVPMLRRAVACFLAQTHPACELLVLHENRDHSTAAYLAGLNEPAIRSVVVPSLPRMTLGAKRNLAMSQARGDCMAVWDDDDWSGPGRLAAQAKVLALSGQPACTLRQVCVWDGLTGAAYLSQARHWECTLLVRIDAMPPYTDVDTGGDVPPVVQMSEAGQLAWVNAPYLYVYIYHGRNVGTRAHFRRNIFDESKKWGPVFSARIATLLRHYQSERPLSWTEVSTDAEP